jgi:hypothetical protein
MTRTSRASLSLLALAVLAPQLAAQERVAPRPVGVSLSRTAGVNELDGVLWGAGDGYQVRFEPWGIEFRPALGSNPDVNDALTLRLRSLGRASETTVALRATPRQAPGDGLRVEYDRGAVTERYDVGVDGVEQSFVFHERPAGAGDLVVRFDLTTELTIAREGKGLRFERPGVGGFHVGGVTGIDARGARAEGIVRVVAGVLELALPEAFVATAALPLTLDPLIGNAFRVSGSTTDSTPRVAYDVSNNVYLVVWRAGSAVHGHRVSAAGTPVGTRLIIAATGTDPDVANIDGRDVFVVLFLRGNSILEARLVRAASGGLSETFTFPGAVNVSPSIAGGRGSASMVAMCAWAEAASGAVKAARLTVDPDRRPAFLLGTVQTVALNAAQPALSSIDAARSAIVYTRVAGGQPLVHTRMLDGNGQALTPEQVVSVSNFPQGEPQIAGDGTNWIVAWVDGGIAWARALRYSSRLGTITPTSLRVGLGDLANDGPSVTWTGETCLVGSLNSGAFVVSLDLLGCTLCEGVLRPTTGLAVPWASAKIEGFGAPDDALVVGNDSSGILAQLFHAADGIVTSRGVGCGSGGIAYATCARSPNPLFAHQLLAAPPNAPTIFCIAASESPLVCGGCTLVPDLRSAILLPLATSAAGEARVAVRIPASSPLRGVPLVEQWATINLTNPACTNFQIDLSDALRVVIE